MRKWKQATAGALAAMMTLSLAACGQGETGKDDSKGKDDGQKVEASGSTLDQLDPDAEPKYDPFGKYEPGIKVTTVHPGIDGGFWFPEGDDLDNNEYTRAYEEKLGVDYEFLWTCPGSQAETKMNTTIASGEIPDMMSVNPAQFEELYEAGLIEDLSSYIVDYSSKYAKKYLTGQYSRALDAVTRDGKAYGIPCHTSYTDNANVLWVRKDWLDNLNLEAPKTFAELENVMRAFTEDDPDGNGKDDTYAIADSAANSQWGIGAAFFNMFESYPGIWMKDSKGGLQDGMFGEEQKDNTRAALEKLNEYYEKGYLSKEVDTLSWDQYQEDILAGKCGILFGGLWDCYYPLILQKEADMNVDWIPLPIPGVNGQPGKIGGNASEVTSVIVVRKGFEHPEAAVKMANLFHSLNNDPTGDVICPPDGNSLFLVYPLQTYNPSYNTELYETMMTALNGGDEADIPKGFVQFYDQIKEYGEYEKTGKSDATDALLAADWTVYRTYSEVSSMAVSGYYCDNKLLVLNENTRLPDDFTVKYFPTVQKLYSQMVLDVITGKQGIEAYDEFIDKANEIYYDKEKADMDKWFTENGSDSVQDWFDNLD